MTKTKTVLLMIVTALVCLWFAGRLLDWEAERVVDQLYPRDAQGIIQGLEPFAITAKDHTTALVLIHGFMESPADFTDVAQDIAKKSNFDIYVPLLPMHGRNLQSMAQFDNTVISNYVQQYLINLSKKYQKLVIVGHSYGGALLIHLASQNKLPNNTKIILVAPATFIRSNTFIGNVKVYAFRVWRNYCNYPEVGCRFPAYGSGDTAARATIAAEKSLRYFVDSAVLQLYKFDNENRNYVLQQPYSVIMAADDNQVNYQQQKTLCLNNKSYCTFYSFPSGKHMLYWGSDKPAFENLIIKLANQ